MVNLSISTASLGSMLTTQLQSQQATLAQLTAQLSSRQQHNDLTDYAPSDALNLMNLQDSATQSQAYIGVINTVNARLSGYNTTMTDMESITSQAQGLASGNPTYVAANAAGINALATNLLKSVGVDLNQQIGGRYIYAGSRYSTAPVVDLTTLPQPPSSTIYTDNQTLPIYDTGYSASALTMNISTAAPNSTVTIGGTVGSPQNASVTVGGTTYTYGVQPTDTPTTIAAGLSALIAVGYPGTTNTGAAINISNGIATSASAMVTNTSAYAVDSATIGQGFSTQYGVTSNDPAFQQLIAGLRYLQAAGSTTNAATYKTDITQANTLLGSALTSLQAVHAGVADNINMLTSEKQTQNTAITNLTTQLTNIQQVNVTQVATELNLLQTQLQASYSATGTLEKMSIVSYL